MYIAKEDARSDIPLLMSVHSLTLCQHSNYIKQTHERLSINTVMENNKSNKHESSLFLYYYVSFLSNTYILLINL